MYILNIGRAIKKMYVNERHYQKSETLTLKTIINELEFLKKAVIIQLNA